MQARARFRCWRTSLPIAAIVALFTYGLVQERAAELDERDLLWLVGALCVIAFSELGVVLVNWIATLLATPRALPRLDYLRRHPGRRAHAGGGADA